MEVGLIHIVAEGDHAVAARSGDPHQFIQGVGGCVARRELALRSLEDGGVLDAFELVVGGDTCRERKPHPEPLLHALRTLGVPTEAALMVGDSSNDVDAARAAGVPVVVVPYGYNGGEDPRLLNADAHVSGLAELPALLAATAARDSA